MSNVKRGGMKRRGMARRTPDAGRAASHTSRPGIDPRVWISYAVVTDLGYDPKAGVFADVKLQPTGEPETAYVAVPYAGGGFGAWWPVAVGDTVVVAIPDGDTGSGPVILGRVWNSGDPPPVGGDWAASAASLEPPTDAVISLQAGRTYKLRTSGGAIDLEVQATGDLKLTNLGTGNVTVEALGTGKVKLGVAETAQPLTLNTPLKTAVMAASATLKAAAGGITDTVLQAAVVAALDTIAASLSGTTKTEAT